MYYVIKKQTNSLVSTVIGFEVPKYIVSKNSENVIFEFIKDDKPLRKWVNKDDIVLLTDNREFFLKTLEKFKKIEGEQLLLIGQAQEELDRTIKDGIAKVNETIEEFNKLKYTGKVPCILKKL